LRNTHAVISLLVAEVFLTSQSLKMNQEIPGLFSADQGNAANVDWSNDGQAGNGGPDGGAAKQNMIMLGGKSLLADLTMEKDNLDQGFVHSHRLLDNGKALKFVVF
jgi:hypothetical protein